MAAIKEMEIEIPDLDTDKPKWKFPRDVEEGTTTQELKIMQVGTWQGKNPFPVMSLNGLHDKFLISLLGQNELLQDLKKKYGEQKEWKGQSIKLTVTDKKKWRLAS